MIENSDNKALTNDTIDLLSTMAAHPWLGGLSAHYAMFFFLQKILHTTDQCRA